MSELSERLLVLAFVFLLAISGIAFLGYPGSPAAFVLFDSSYLAIVLLVYPKPRLYVYTFFALVLFLGFWLKFMIHMISGSDFLEPIGNFSNSKEEWDLALFVASFAAIGVALARGIHLYGAKKFSALTDISQNVGAVPTWFIALRKPVWITSIALMLGLNVLNFQPAFYQIGVNPKLILPAHLNVILAWLTYIGFSLWFAVMIHWETSINQKALASNMLAPIVEGFLCSISTISRALYLVHTIPYWLALVEQWPKLHSALNRGTITRLFTLWVLCFALSIVLASWLRINIYLSDPLVAGTPVTAVNRRNMAIQVANLFVDRWIGMEGVLAVSAHPHLGYALFLDGIREDPRKGNYSKYQLIAKSGYKESERFTFLTLPGIVAVLFYSGSFLTVLLGMIIATIVMIGTEVAASRWVGNPFLLSMTGFAMTHVVCQVNFLYLTMIFFLQLWVALAVIWAVHLRLLDVSISKTGASPADTVKE